MWLPDCTTVHTNCAVQSIPNLNKEQVLILPPLLCTLKEKTGLYTSATDIIYINNLETEY